MATIILDDELKRLTSTLVGCAYRATKEEREEVAKQKLALLPGSVLYKFTDPTLPDHFLLQHVFGEEISTRGQELYYIYRRNSRMPLWRMTLDYRWYSTTLISTDVKDEEAREYLGRALALGIEMEELLKPPDFPIKDLDDRLLFRSSIDGNLRDFNGQRYVRIRRHAGSGMYKTHDLYLGEVQGGIF